MITIFAGNVSRGTRSLILSAIVAFILASVFCATALASPAGEAEALLQRIDDCQTAINDANDTIKQAEKDYRESIAAAEKAQKQIDEQEAKMAEYQDALEQLSVSLYKGSRSENPLLELLDASSFEELDDKLNSMDAIAAEEANLIKQARETRDKLDNAKRSYDAHAEKAREKKAAAEQARKDAELLHEELVAEAAKITNDIADSEARTSLASAVADKAFPKGSTLSNPCPDGTVSSEFGYRDFDKSFHQGLDLAAAEGTPYYAAASGTVIYATNDGKDNGGAGNWIVIAHGGGVVTKYMHSQHTLVKPGDIVSKGQLIGSVGQTGAAFGAHLHFQVEVDGTAVDPVKAMKGKLKK